MAELFITDKSENNSDVCKHNRHRQHVIKFYNRILHSNEKNNLLLLAKKKKKHNRDTTLSIRRHKEYILYAFI